MFLSCTSIYYWGGLLSKNGFYLPPPRKTTGMSHNLPAAYKGKRIFLTGHTGFKGSWLLQILHGWGAIVKGYSLPPENTFDLYHQIDGESLCAASVMGDINDAELLKKELLEFEPDVVFHLAAQSLVRRSYDSPVSTFLTNTQGTVHVLDAIRHLEKECIGVMVTTDKVYENPESGEPFKEEDKLGGYDPYSASKAAAEIAISSYRRSFFLPENLKQHQKSIAAARAGNVIGGGDFAQDRIIPDIVRALEKGESVQLRNPQSIRPWQHVLESLSGYLLLGAKMMEAPQRFAQAYNFGPEPADFKTVEEVTQLFLKTFDKPDAYKKETPKQAPHEAKLLILDSTKAKSELDWQPRLSAAEAVAWTAGWYADKKVAVEKCREQIAAYFAMR